MAHGVTARAPSQSWQDKEIESTPLILSLMMHGVEPRELCEITGDAEGSEPRVRETVALELSELAQAETGRELELDPRRLHERVLGATCSWGMC